MKCQILFSGKNKKNNIILSSAENAQRVVKVKLNLHSQIVVAWKITNFILVTLTPFSRSQEGSDCWIMACLHAIC